MVKLIVLTFYINSEAAIALSLFLVLEILSLDVLIKKECTGKRRTGFELVSFG